MNFLRKKIELLKKAIAVIQEILRLKKKKKDYHAFCEAIKKAESNNNYQIVNSYGYMGAYQFGMARLCDLGFTERKSGTTGFSNKSFIWKSPYSRKIFLNNPGTQDRAFDMHVEDLIKQIKGFCKGKYLLNGNTHIDNIPITLSGCVAFAHLAGFGGLKKFLKGGFDPKDIASGVPASTYMRKFAGYDLEV